MKKSLFKYIECTSVLCCTSCLKYTQPDTHIMFTITDILLELVLMFTQLGSPISNHFYLTGQKAFVALHLAKNIVEKQAGTIILSPPTLFINFSFSFSFSTCLLSPFCRHHLARGLKHFPSPLWI